MKSRFDVYTVVRNGVVMVDPRDVKGINAVQLLAMESNLYYQKSEVTQAAVDDLPFRWHRPRLKTLAWYARDLNSMVRFLSTSIKSNQT